MQSRTKVENRTLTNRIMKTGPSEVLESRLVSDYTIPQALNNGVKTNAINVFPGSMESGATKDCSREIAHRRYQMLIKSVAERMESPATARLNKAGASTFWQRLQGEWLIAPFFLFSSLAIILLIPEKLVKKISEPFTKTEFWDQVGKRVFDFAGALAGFIFSSIFFFVVPLLIKLDSKGPVFYGQQRAGLNHRRGDRRQVNIAVAHERRVGERRQQDLFGRPFTVYKFRTMTADAEKYSGAVWAQKNDPRTTRIGRVLRFIHLDEIPQFFNVLCGEMSLVGPRPERPQIMSKLVEDIPQFPERLQVKPGITGIAQIYCGYDATIDDAREKLRYDLMYVKNSTLKSDVTIMLKTLWMIINGREVV